MWLSSFLQERVHFEGAGLHQGGGQVSSPSRLLRDGSLRLRRRRQDERLPGVDVITLFFLHVPRIKNKLEF
jgi:hypothetical protein